MRKFKRNQISLRELWFLLGPGGVIKILYDKYRLECLMSPNKIKVSYRRLENLPTIDVHIGEKYDNVVVDMDDQVL
jgi:hypothetical protein